MEPPSQPSQPRLRRLSDECAGMPSLALGRWWSPYGETGDVSVVSVDLTPDAARESKSMGWLCNEELTRWDRYHFAGPRRQFALTRAALRAILCCRLDCENQQLTFGISKYGKPFALVSGAPSGNSFNVSHSGRYGLLAFAPEGRVGVDVEERVVRQDIDELGSAVFSPGELAEIVPALGEAKHRLFYDLWAMKEAVIKALGTGLYMNPAFFEVPLPLRQGDREGMLKLPGSPGVAWRLSNIGNEHFAAAVARESVPNEAKADRRGETS